MIAKDTIISLSQKISTDSDVLILEQEEWDDNINRFTTMDLIDQVEDVLYGTSYSHYQCGVNEGKFVTAIFVYPFDTNLNYDLGVTWGNLSEANISDIIVTEAVNFSLDTEKELTYPVRSIIDNEWYEGVWDSAGNQLKLPTISFDGQIVKSNKKIYGSLKVTYVTERHTYRLEVPAREDVVENFFTSVAYARWNGGVKMLEIDSPINAEDDYFKGLDCRSRTILRINPNDPPWRPPTVEGDSEIQLIDYCDQTEI